MEEIQKIFPYVDKGSATVQNALEKLYAMAKESGACEDGPHGQDESPLWKLRSSWLIRNNIL